MTLITDLFRSSAPRKEVAVVIAMKGDIEHVGITVEGLLTSVAMVNVLRCQVKSESVGNYESVTRGFYGQNKSR